MDFPQRARQVDLRSQMKHDWIVCMNEKDEGAELAGEEEIGHPRRVEEIH